MKEYKVYQTYTQVDVMTVEANSEEEAVDKAIEKPNFEDYETNEIDYHAEAEE